MYIAIDKKIINRHNAGTKYEESFDVAMCASHDQACRAIEMMNRAHSLNDRRRYTDSARLFFKVEQLPGFVWLSTQASDTGIPA